MTSSLIKTTWRVSSSGLGTCLENSGYGDEPYGDRHVSSPPLYAGRVDWDYICFTRRSRWVRFPRPVPISE
jgi:hypothetical protein